MRGFGELLAALARCSADPVAEIRRPDALGAHLEAPGENPFFNAAIVPAGVAPPADDPLLPYCLWTVAAAVPGRVEVPDLATPVMGLDLNDPTLDFADRVPYLETPSLAELGDLNERAYGDFGWFSSLVQTLRDDRIRVAGLRHAGAFVCVALTLAVEDDLGIHYVATAEGHRRQGLATALVRTLLAAARADGMCTATLQASADGLPVWERLGFQTVATLRGYVRAGTAS